MKITFDATSAFEACNQAEAWCSARDISVGSAQQGAPRGLLRGPYAVAKWRNLSALDREGLDGTMTGDMRHGPVTIELKGTEEDYPEVAVADDVSLYDVDIYGANLVGGRRLALDEEPDHG